MFSHLSVVNLNVFSHFLVFKTLHVFFHLSVFKTLHLFSHFSLNIKLHVSSQLSNFNLWSGLLTAHG